MKLVRSQILIGCAVLVTLLTVGTCVFVSSTPSAHLTENVKPVKRAQGSPACHENTNEFGENDETALTETQKSLLVELQRALDDENYRRVAEIATNIMHLYNKEGDAAIPPNMREKVVEALSWFLSNSLAELLGFMTNSNPGMLEDVIKTFSESTSSVTPGDRELARVFKQVAPHIKDDDAIDAILMGIENDMRNSVAIDTYKEILRTGSKAIKQRLVESMQDFTGEDNISTPEQLDAWLKENPDDEDDEEFYGKADKDDDD